MTEPESTEQGDVNLRLLIGRHLQLDALPPSPIVETSPKGLRHAVLDRGGTTNVESGHGHQASLAHPVEAFHAGVAWEIGYARASSPTHKTRQSCVEASGVYSLCQSNKNPRADTVDH